jgi:small subunit ribosomal protein S4
MARYLDAKCRLCRREGQKLFLKGSKCYSDKCAIERRPYAPGMHGQSRRAKVSDYGLQLREKQKVKRIYGLQEKQFREYYEVASRTPGVTGLNLLHLLESRLDNVIYRMGLATSRAESRQLIRHKQVKVDGQTVTIPSFRVNVGGRVSLAEAAREHLRINAAAEFAGSHGTADWIDVDLPTREGVFRELPARDQLDQSIREQLIVELYSK